MKKGFAVLLTLLALCSFAHAEASRTFFAMDTVMTLRSEDASDDLLEDCEAEVLRLEALLSVTDPDSEISRLNRTGKAVLSRDTFGLLEFAKGMGRRTGGALDVTLYPIVRAWGFTADQARVPGEAELELLLQRVDYRKITLHADGAAQLPEGVMVDLGSIAKGYASDRIADRLRQEGVQSALIDLGGNLYCLGTKPDGSDWRVGIRSPLGDSYCAALSVRDRAVVTSGNYERSFTAADGTRYGHIFDPGTGCPVDGDLLSATVIGQEGALCDALSTEAALPALSPIPGIKLGLSNIITVYAMFAIGPRDALAILCARILLGAFVTGNVSALMYSAAGGVLCYLSMLLLRRILSSKQIWIASVIGAAFHNIGQVLVAVAITRTAGLFAYLPVLMASGMIAGLFTGLCGQMLASRLKHAP